MRAVERESESEERDKGNTSSSSSISDARDLERDNGGEATSESTTYQPASTSWGVFERPNNISKAYGGGKNIPYGGEQKNAEELEEKRKKTLAKIQQYRQKRMQLEEDANLEDDTLAKAKFSIERGKSLMRAGQLTSAKEEFQSAAKLVSPKSSIGGEALLQIAICLDSMGRYEEAQERYKKLTSHRDYTISKQANKFLFGFEAAEALKTEKYKYDANSKTKSYRPYFDLVSRGEWDTMYVNTETEEEQEKKKLQDLFIIFFVVVAFPLCILGGIKTFH